MQASIQGLFASTTLSTGAGNIAGTFVAIAPRTGAGDVAGTFAAIAASTSVQHHRHFCSHNS